MVCRDIQRLLWVALEREQTSILQLRGTEVAALPQDGCVSRSSPNTNILLGRYNICQEIYRINWQRFSSYLKAVATGSTHESFKAIQGAIGWAEPTSGGPFGLRFVTSLQ